jgi:Skp family chaperone for outer membrane proteins
MMQKELELKNAEALLVNNKDQMDKKKYEAEIAIFQKNVSNAQKYAQQSKVKLEKAQSDVIMQINKHVIDIIASICNKKGCNVVLPSSQILYAADTLNISPEVLEELNSTIKSIKVNF